MISAREQAPPLSGVVWKLVQPSLTAALRRAGPLQAATAVQGEPAGAVLEKPCFGDTWSWGPFLAPVKA